MDFRQDPAWEVIVSNLLRGPVMKVNSILPTTVQEDAREKHLGIGLGCSALSGRVMSGRVTLGSYHRLEISRLLGVHLKVST
jgi:hypothetical protein